MSAALSQSAVSSSERLADVEDDGPHSHDATSSRSAGEVTLTSRGSPSTALIRPPWASTSGGAVGSLARGSAAERVREEGLRRLRHDEPVAVKRLHDLVPLDALHGVRHRKHGHRTVVALGQRRDHAAEHVVAHERSSRVVHDDHGRLVGNLRERAPDRARARVGTRHHRPHLSGGELLREHDHGLLPARRGGDDDAVDPVGVVQTSQRLGNQREVAEPRKRLRTVVAEPLAPSSRGENGPHAHAMRPRRPSSWWSTRSSPSPSSSSSCRSFRSCRSWRARRRASRRRPPRRGSSRT